MATTMEIHATHSDAHPWIRRTLAALIAPSDLGELASSALDDRASASPSMSAAGPVPISLDYEDQRSHHFRSLGRGMLDAAMLVIAFLTADLLRCLFWQETRWPQRPLNVYQDWY